MKLTYIDYNDLPFIATRDLHYLKQDPKLRPFYTYEPVIEAFTQVIEARKKHPVDRNLLADILLRQYQERSTEPHTITQIEQLRAENTFTVITAHQPSLFTGPLYYIYKILSCIHLSQQVEVHNPDYRIIPLFILGGEDHDFAEINHLHLGDKTIEWQHPMTGGACGRLSLDGLAACIEDVKRVLGDASFTEEVISTLQECYSGEHNYAEATIRFIHHLFGQLGLVILNMDEPEFKATFKQFIIDDLIAHRSAQLVPPVQAELEAAGYPAQAFVRDINLFYFSGNQRERIEQDDNGYLLVDTLQHFTREELLEIAEQHPERFSPNVILRPLYQETIVPNLAYIGGGGELAYWLERKKQFQYYDLPFPMLVRRNSAAWLDEHAQASIRKGGRPLTDYFVANTDALIADFIRDTSNISLEDARAEMELIFKQIMDQGQSIDSKLSFPIEGVRVRMNKYLDRLEQKMVRAEKRKQEPAIHRLLHNHHLLFPNHTLQERYSNFLPIYTRQGRKWLDELLPYFDPLDHRFLLFEA